MAAAVALAPDDPALRKELAAACYRANRLPEALAEFEAALKIAADDGRAHFNAAALLLATDPSRREEAARHYDEAIRLGERRDESFEKKLGR
jgi:tetratricopeptide (TPR) repeat protein